MLPDGTFRRWLDKKGRIGSQAKVPRLTNDRRHVDDILQMIDLPLAPNEVS
jgi:hypothetical protein